jgi:hypothetical protein
MQHAPLGCLFRVVSSTCLLKPNGAQTVSFGRVSILFDKTRFSWYIYMALRCFLTRFRGRLKPQNEKVPFIPIDLRFTGNAVNFLNCFNG